MISCVFFEKYCNFAKKVPLKVNNDTDIFSFEEKGVKHRIIENHFNDSCVGVTRFLYFVGTSDAI